MAVKIGTGTDQAVKRIDHLAAAHDDDAHRADARALAVGRFEIYGCKIFHRIGICELQIYAFPRRSVHPERKNSVFRRQEAPFRSGPGKLRGIVPETDGLHPLFEIPLRNERTQPHARVLCR